MDRIIACIGSGNMGAALMKGVAKVTGGGAIGLADVDKTKAKQVAEQMGAYVYGSNAEAVQEADVVFLAVKPQALQAALEEIAPVIKKRATSTRPATLVSMAAGWSIAKIQAVAGKTPVVRIMPNTPALIGKGVIAFAPSPETPDHVVEEIRRMLSQTGVVDRLEESYFNAVTGLSGSGPAFVCLFIEALADGGVRAGLPRDKALRYAAQTALGSAAMVLETGRHPAELKDMVASPAGTTIVGIAALEAGAFRGVVMNAVHEASKKSAELDC
ncbi:MAG: pyrroline-5-carboxylate reductase [Treponema sp.]|jgi:pyrroline-5-carboxylate reductase|nr:pyrroline-5-carboxylate reductase [Treponema sp.]